jgi:hypothetical protein
MRDDGAERGPLIDPVTSELPDGPFEAKGFEKGLSLKRFDSELHPATSIETAAATANRLGERIGPTRLRM